MAATLLADKVCGLTIVYSVAAALYRRAQTGEGEHIEVPMRDTVEAFLLVEHGSAAVPRPPLGPAGYPRILSPHRRPWPTRDGWMIVMPYSKDHFDHVFAAGGRHDLIGDERYATGRERIANAGFLYGEVGRMLADTTTAEWLALFRRDDVPAGEVATLDQLVDDLPEADHPHVGTYKLPSRRPCASPGPRRACGDRRRSLASTPTRCSPKSATARRRWPRYGCRGQSARWPPSWRDLRPGLPRSSMGNSTIVTTNKTRPPRSRSTVEPSGQPQMELQTELAGVARSEPGDGGGNWLADLDDRRGELGGQHYQ